MRASVKSFAIGGDVRGIRKLKKTTANINISKRIHRLKVVNDIVRRRRQRYEKIACLCYIGPKELKVMPIVCLIMGTLTALSDVCVLLFVR